jgi:hypothetical protein
MCENFVLSHNGLIWPIIIAHASEKRVLKDKLASRANWQLLKIMRKKEGTPTKRTRESQKCQWNQEIIQKHSNFLDYLIV